MSEHLEQFGRLAFREEDGEWRAYLAEADTMNEATLLGSIMLMLVQREDRKAAFMQLMQDVFGDLVEAAVGQRPVWPKPPQRAPEHERKN